MHHGVLGWASGCESGCVIPNQWLWIMVCYTDPVVVNHGMLSWGIDNYFTYFVPVFKYCYSDSRNLWTVMRAGGLAP